jgi:voltage-gated potassium channel
MEHSKLYIPILLLAGIIALGTSGYMIIEHIPMFDSFYMTLITISSVGFSEIVPLSQAGRILTVGIIISGISLLTYTLGQVAQIFVEGEIRKIFGRRKLEKQISMLNNHFIICGYGRIGEVICRELADEKIPFIVIEENEEKIQYLEKDGFLYLNKDATTEETLLQAGLERARGLVTAVSTDADNVFITLTAKSLRPDIFILSRAADLKNERKLLRAGASRVVCPYYMGGSRMAQILKKPTVVDFLETAMMSGELGLKMEEAVIQSSSHLVGKTLVESRLRMDFGVIIVAIKKSSNEMVFNPGPTAILEAGDVIVVIGKQEEMNKMREILV